MGHRNRASSRKLLNLCLPHSHKMTKHLVHLRFDDVFDTADRQNHASDLRAGSSSWQRFRWIGAARANRSSCDEAAKWQCQTDSGRTQIVEHGVFFVARAWDVQKQMTSCCRIESFPSNFEHRSKAEFELQCCRL